eukprot:764326-Hanusia_phi.AAC.3
MPDGQLTTKPMILQQFVYKTTVSVWRERGRQNREKETGRGRETGRQDREREGGREGGTKENVRAEARDRDRKRG